MKPTDEELDYPDSMPPRANNSIETPPEIQAEIERRKAARVRGATTKAERGAFAKGAPDAAR